MFDDISKMITALIRIIKAMEDDYEQLGWFESMDFSELGNLDIYCSYDNNDDGPLINIPCEHWEEFRQLILKFMEKKLKTKTERIHIAYRQLKEFDTHKLFTPYAYPTVTIINPLSRVKQTKAKPETEKSKSKPKSQRLKVQFWIVRETTADEPQIIESQSRPKKGKILGGYAKRETAETALLDMIKKKPESKKELKQV